MTDNVAILDGYTELYFLASDNVELVVLVKPGTDLTDSFKAWDTDMQEYIRVNGWLFTSEKLKE